MDNSSSGGVVWCATWFLEAYVHCLYKLLAALLVCPIQIHVYLFSLYNAYT